MAVLTHHMHISHDPQDSHKAYFCLLNVDLVDQKYALCGSCGSCEFLFSHRFNLFLFLSLLLLFFFLRERKGSSAETLHAVSLRPMNKSSFWTVCEFCHVRTTLQGHVAHRRPRHFPELLPRAPSAPTTGSLVGGGGRGCEGKGGREGENEGKNMGIYILPNS